MAYSPKPAGPRTIRALFHYLWRELTEIGVELESGGFGGEANTSSSPGSGDSLVLAKVGIDLPFKSLVAGTNVSIDVGADTLTINSSGGGGNGGRTLIETITNVTAGTFDFDNIPGTFNTLVIEGHIRSTRVSEQDQVNVYFNNDLTDGNYIAQRFAGVDTGTSIADVDVPEILFVPCTGSLDNMHGPVNLVMQDYANTSILKTITGSQSYMAPTTNRISIFAGFNAVVHETQTAAVTRLLFRSLNQPTAELAGELRLYGVD